MNFRILKEILLVMLLPLSLVNAAQIFNPITDISEEFLAENPGFITDLSSGSPFFIARFAYQQNPNQPPVYVHLALNPTDCRALRVIAVVCDVDGKPIINRAAHSDESTALGNVRIVVMHTFRTYWHLVPQMCCHNNRSIELGDDGTMRIGFKEPYTICEHIFGRSVSSTFDFVDQKLPNDPLTGSFNTFNKIPWGEDKNPQLIAQKMAHDIHFARDLIESLHLEIVEAASTHEREAPVFYQGDYAEDHFSRSPPADKDLEYLATFLINGVEIVVYINPTDNQRMRLIMRPFNRNNTTSYLNQFPSSKEEYALNKVLIFFNQLFWKKGLVPQFAILGNNAMRAVDNKVQLGHAKEPYFFHAHLYPAGDPNKTYLGDKPLMGPPVGEFFSLEKNKKRWGEESVMRLKHDYVTLIKDNLELLGELSDPGTKIFVSI